MTMKNRNKTVPSYELRGLKLIGWRDISHALCFLFSKRGYIKNGALIAINAEKILKLERNSKIKNLIEKAEFKYADGFGIIRSLRKKYPYACISRIPGVDLWEAIMKRAGSNNLPVFLVGGRSDVLHKTKQKLFNQWKVNIVGTQDGYFKTEEEHVLFTRIRDSKAKIVTVAMGSPKQEILMRNCYLVHPGALYMGVGGTYDVFTGKVKRAPKLWQKLGLEWLYRLLLQPNRVSRQLHLLRYLFLHCTRQL